MSSTCDRCGTSAPTGAGFCPTCGTPLADTPPTAAPGSGTSADAGTGPVGGEWSDPGAGSGQWGDPGASDAQWGDPGAGGAQWDPPPVGWGAPPPPGPSGLSSDARNLGLLAHLSAFVTLVGVPSFVGPLVIWLWKREDDRFVAEHAKEALNFNLSVLLYAIVGGIVAAIAVFVTLGLGMLLVVPLAIALGIAWFVLVIVAGLAASRGEGYRYPVTIRFIS